MASGMSARAMLKPSGPATSATRRVGATSSRSKNPVSRSRPAPKATPSPANAAPCSTAKGTVQLRKLSVGKSGRSVSAPNEPLKASTKNTGMTRTGTTVAGMRIVPSSDRQASCRETATA